MSDFFLTIHPLTQRSDIPINTIMSNPTTAIPLSGNEDHGDGHETYVVCRLGNDSQLAVMAMREAGVAGVLKDLVGGLRAWTQDVDPAFPVY